jgi:hypothetical protein
VPNAVSTIRSVRQRGRAGGPGMQGGARFQNQLTAWLAVKMLAEQPAAPIIPRGKLTYLAAELGSLVTLWIRSKLISQAIPARWPLRPDTPSLMPRETSCATHSRGLPVLKSDGFRELLTSALVRQACYADPLTGNARGLMNLPRWILQGSRPTRCPTYRQAEDHVQSSRTMLPFCDRKWLTVATTTPAARLSPQFRWLRSSPKHIAVRTCKRQKYQPYSETVDDQFFENHP